MKRLIAAAAFALFCTTANAQSISYVNVGDKVPEFTVEMTDGSTIDIADLKGKVVLINFWATWCGPCRNELKRVPEEVVERFKDNEDFVFLPISRGEDKATVIKFLEEQGYTWVSGLDPETKIFPLFANQSIPRNYVVGRDGTVIHAERGYWPEKFGDMVELIAKSLEKK